MLRNQHKPSSWRSRIDLRLAFWLCALLVGFFQLTLVTLYDSSSSDHRNNGDLVYLLDVPPPRPVRRELKWKHVDAEKKNRNGALSASQNHSLLVSTNAPIREPVIPKSALGTVPKKIKKTRRENEKTKEKRVQNGTDKDKAMVVDVVVQMQEIQKAGKLYSIGRKDRSGSVIADQMFAHAFAYAHGVEYAGACFTTKGLPKRDTLTLLSQLGWDSYLKFGCPKGESIFNDPDAENSPLVLPADVYRHKIVQSYFTKAWRDEIQRLLQRNISRATPDVIAGHKPFEIAVHVRRGDVTPCRYKRRYLPNDHYMALIDQYLPTDKPAHVTIYSESDSFESFDNFRDRGFDVQLDTDLAEVWKAFASADVTILSRSFFSFVPAAVNPNTVVFTAFFGFEPLENWKRADDVLVAKTDKQIRHLYNTKCNATAIELERQLQDEKHVVKR